MWGRNGTDGGNSGCKGPEVGVGLACMRNSKEVAGGVGL